LLRGKDNELEQLRSEIRSLKYNKNSPNLRQAINETQKQANMEKQRADNLTRTLASKENQLRSLSNSLGEKDQLINSLRNKLNGSVNSGELQNARNLLNEKENELRRLKQENMDMANQWRSLQGINEQLKNNQNNMRKGMEEEQNREMEKMLREKELSNQRMLQLKDQQMRQLQENLDFFKKQAIDFQKEAQNAKESKNQKVEDLEKMLEDQNDQMKLMRRDIMQMEKAIEDKDNALKKMTEIQYQGMWGNGINLRK
jgi:chromosome segregation ATPase